MYECMYVCVYVNLHIMCVKVYMQKYNLYVCRRGATGGQGALAPHAFFFLFCLFVCLFVFIFVLLVSSAVSHVHDDNSPTPLW